MGVKDAVTERFAGICRQRKMKYNELAVRSGVTPSTVYSMMDPKRRDVSIITIKILCDGVSFQKDREMVTGGDLFMKKGGKIRKTP